MKKLIYFLVAFSLFFFAQSCGNNDSENDNESKDSLKTENNKTEGETSIVSNVKEFAYIPELLKKTEFTAEEFCGITNFLFQKEITLLVYPYAYPGNKEVKIYGKRMQMLSAKDNSIKQVKIGVTFKDELAEQTVSAGKLLAIKGKLDAGYSVSEKWGNAVYIKIYDAELLPSFENSYETFSSIADLDLNNPVFSGDLANALTSVYETLNKKETITLTGIYYSTTTSKDSNGNIINTRVDIGEKAVNPKYKIGCNFDESVNSDELEAQRSAGKKITIEGKFGGSDWNPKLIHCKIK